MVQTATQTGSDFRNFDALILDQLTDAERARSVAYLDEQLRPPGRIDIEGSEIESSDPFVLAFVDRKPGANWMHPCRYLLIDPATRNITSIDSDRPPVFGPLPPTWRVVWRSPGIDDWRLLTTSRPHSQ